MLLNLVDAGLVSDIVRSCDEDIASAWRPFANAVGATTCNSYNSAARQTLKLLEPGELCPNVRTFFSTSFVLV